MRTVTLEFAGALDLRATLLHTGAAFRDPTLRLGRDEAVRATRTPEGPATLHAVQRGPGAVEVRAWGAGAQWALGGARAWLGLDDVAAALPEEAPRRVREIARRATGLRLARTGRVFELLVSTVLEQLVTGRESSRAFANLVRHFSEPAPGPFEDLWLPLGPEQLRAIPVAAFPALGALPRQGATLLELARRAGRVEEAAVLDAEAAERRLRAFPGVGVWTARSVMLHGMGFADAVPLGDYHLARFVSHALTGDAEADDARMLALLEPYRGQRGRVLRWITHVAPTPPRRGPRMAVRPLGSEGSRLVRGLR